MRGAQAVLSPSLGALATPSLWHTKHALSYTLLPFSPLSAVASTAPAVAVAKLISTRRASASLPLPVVSTGGFMLMRSRAMPADSNAVRTFTARCLASSRFCATLPVLSV